MMFDNRFSENTKFVHDNSLYNVKWLNGRCMKEDNVLTWPRGDLNHMSPCIVQRQVPAYILNNCFFLCKVILLVRNWRGICGLSSRICVDTLSFSFLVLCLTGLCATSRSDPVSTIRNSCELNSLDGVSLRCCHHLGICNHKSWQNLKHYLDSGNGERLPVT